MFRRWRGPDAGWLATRGFALRLPASGGMAPEPGGFLDQGAWLMDVFEVMAAAEADADAADSRRR